MPATVSTRRLFSWAVETRVRGTVDAAAVVLAERQLRGVGVSRVWLLEAGGASGLDGAALPQVRASAASLRKAGLERIALVVPMLVRAFLGTISLDVQLVTFDSRERALAWLRSGCPAAS